MKNERLWEWQAFILGVEHEWKGKEEKGWKSTRRKEDGRKV